MNPQELQSLAERLGILTSYIDVDDNRRQASTGALEAAVEILTEGGTAGPADVGPLDEVVLVRGSRWHRGVESTFETTTNLTVVFEDGSTISVPAVTGLADLQQRLPAGELPRGIHTLHWEAGGPPRRSTLIAAPTRFPVERRRRPGLAVFTPAYAIWSDDDLFPSYDGLDRLGRVVAGLGVATIATLPLYSPGFGPRFDRSPYSPISRFHWNELLIPARRLQGSGGDNGPHDRADQLLTPSEAMDWVTVERVSRQRLDAAVSDLDHSRRASLEGFLTARPDVVSFARWAGGGDPASVRRHELGQLLAEESLAEVSARLDGRGQRLALDLPVGARIDSWETAEWPELFAAGASIGAPPDTFFADGQNWGLPPLNPAASRRSGHRVWYDLLMQACRYARVLRIDHVMQVFRLWWVPAGNSADDGVYVRYPAEELLAVAAVVAEATGTIMVGEDLGTVPPEVRRLLDDWGMVGMHEEGFVLHGVVADGPDAPAALPPVVERSWAGIRTHDMAPLATMIDALDTAGYRLALAASIGRDDVPTAGELAVSMMTRLRRSDAYEVVVDIDDVLEGTAPHNVPGIVADSNWSHRLPVPVEALVDEPRMALVLGAGATDQERTVEPDGTPAGS